MPNRPFFCGWKLTIALILTLVIGNTGFAQKGGGGKPPKEDPPPEVNLPNYSITILGTLGGGWATTTGMNNLGDVVGLSENQLGGSEPYLYTAADGMVALNSLVDPIGGWTIGQANDINDSGVIVGYGYFDSDGDGTPDPPRMAIRFLPDSDGDGFGNVEPLPIPGNSPNATGVNAEGDITGQFHDGVWHAFLWRPESGFQDLGTFNGGQTLATGISNRDAQGDVQIVGRYDWRAFRFTTGVGFEDLGTLKSDDTGSSEARAINAFGDIAGWADADPKKGNDNSFGFLFVDGVGMISLGTLSAGRDWNDSEATSLNDLQEVVGTSLTTSPDMRAFYFNSETGMLDLESLIDNLPAELAGTIVPARINNSGQVCGPRVDNFNNLSGPAYIISKTP